jgi:hypothetical protein
MNAINMKPKSFPMWLLVLVMLAMLIVPALQIATDTGISMHAAVKHGLNAVAAQACKSNPGSRLFFNPTTQRTGLVCEVEGKWAVVILDKMGDEVTSFVKRRQHTFEQVLRYMQNAGYLLVH